MGEELKPGIEPGTQPNPTRQQSPDEMHRSKADGVPENKGGANGSGHGAVNVGGTGAGSGGFGGGGGR